MGKKVYFSIICALALSVNAADLGTINVESSTIVGSDIDAKTEVSTVNVIDEKTIEQINPKNIGELLQTIPGITADVRSDVVEIHMRGIGQQEFMWEDTGVAIVIDGVPVLQDGGKVRFNMNEIESIKVIKGGASYLYGDTALAGAVIITTKKNKDKNGGEISLEAGSYGYKNAKAKFYKSTDKYSINVGTSYKEEDGYWANSANDETAINGLFTYYINDMSDISVGIDYTNGYTESARGSVTGVTEARINPTADGDFSWTSDQDTEYGKYFAKYNKDFENGGNLLVNIYYYKDSTSDKSTPIDTSGDVNASGSLVYDGTDDGYAREGTEDVKQYGFKAEYRNEINSLAYLIGTDIGERNSEAYDEVVLTGVSDDDDPTDEYDVYYAGENSYSDDEEKKFALYTEIKNKFTDKFTAVFNIRYDHDKYTTDETELNYNEDTLNWDNTASSDDVSYDNLSYRGGVTYNIDDTKTWYTNISTGFRNPKIRQYSTNVDIDQETTITYETGLRGTMLFGANYEASIFVTDTKDIISKLEGTYYSRNDIYDNVGDSRSKGLELSLKGRVKEEVSYSFAYTYLDSYYTSRKPFYVNIDSDGDGNDDSFDVAGNQLPRVPHHKIDVIVNYKFMPKWNLMTELYAQSKYYADETNFVTMPGYAKVNLRVDYNYNKSLNFFVKVDNVLDKQYYRTVFLFSDRNGDDVLDAEDASITVDPGRVFYAGFKYKF